MNVLYYYHIKQTQIFSNHPKVSCSTYSISASEFLADSEKDYENEFIRRLQDTIREIKKSREMGARYMTFQELLKDERVEGRAEGIIRILRKYGASDEEIIRQLIDELAVDDKIARDYLSRFV